MKKLAEYINEAYEVNFRDRVQPKTTSELKQIIKDAFNHTRKIDYDLVHSQETRRILDRIIGFRLSKLMQSKTGGKSAGRVQSVALKLIVDREREIESFKEEEYWTVTAKFTDMEASLDTVDGKKADLKTEE